MALVPMSPAETTAVIDAVKARGFDPGVVRSCMPSSDLQRLGGVKGIVGCNEWDRCPFGLTRNGGFKAHTTLPKNVVYSLFPNDNTKHIKQDILPCHEYVRLLGNKARDGRIDLDEGRNGEVIEIIGMEQGSNLLKPNGTPWPEEYTEVVQIKDPATANTLSPTWIFRTSVKPCPRYAPPSAVAGQDHERQLIAQMNARMSENQEAQTGPQRAAPAEVAEDWPEDESKAARG